MRHERLSEMQGLPTLPFGKSFFRTQLVSCAGNKGVSALRLRRVDRALCCIGEVMA